MRISRFIRSFDRLPRGAAPAASVYQAGAELGTEEHMFSQWRMRSHRFRDVPSHLSSQAKVIVFSLSLI